MLIYSLLMGARRFSEIQKATGMARSLLSNRLKRMQQYALIERRLYDEKLKRYEYILIEKGIDLFATAMMIVRWEKRWHYSPDVPMLHLRHTDCGQAFTPEMACIACNDVINPNDIIFTAGPGDGFDTVTDHKARRSTASPADLDRVDTALGRSMLILGDRWTPALITSEFFGLHRFNAIQEFWNIAPNILSDRLSRLWDLGILDQKIYQKNPPRYEYHLTEKGKDLYPTLLTLMHWGDRWFSKTHGVPHYMTHAACGAKFIQTIRCDQCKGPINYYNVTLDQTPTPK